MSKVLFSGAATAMVTPFRDGEVDIPALDRMIERQLDAGIQALFPCGTTGEPASLSAEEWTRVVRRTVEVVHGRIPVIAGTGGNDTGSVLERAAMARELGANAQLCVTPYYNKTTQKGLLAHYKAILSAGGLPVIVYSVPSRTGMGIAIETCAELAKEDGIIGLKEAGGDVGRTADILALCGDRLPVYSGSDEVNVPMLSIGAKGFVSVLSNLVPAEAAQMARSWSEGNAAEAARIQLKYQRLNRLLFRQVSPIPVKAALSLMGLCENSLRLPLLPLDEEEIQPLTRELKRLEVIA